MTLNDLLTINEQATVLATCVNTAAQANEIKALVIAFGSMVIMLQVVTALYNKRGK